MGTLATVLERLAIGGAIAALVAIPAANYLQELDALETVSDTLEAAQGDSWALILEDSNGETWALETGATLGDCLAARTDSRIDSTVQASRLSLASGTRTARPRRPPPARLRTWRPL